VKVSKKGDRSLTRGDGVVSNLLHGDGSDAPSDLTVTWVEVEPGAEQKIHSHEPEQVYVVVEGGGVMRVGGEEMAVERDDCVHIPSETNHRIANTGDRVLEYVSAATPAFPEEEVEEFYGE